MLAVYLYIETIENTKISFTCVHNGHEFSMLFCNYMINLNSPIVQFQVYDVIY